MGIELWHSCPSDWRLRFMVQTILQHIVGGLDSLHMLISTIWEASNSGSLENDDDEMTERED